MVTLFVPLTKNFTIWCQDLFMHSSIEFKDYYFSEYFCIGFKDYYFIVCYSHKFACLLCPENLKLIAEYFQRSETFGGPLRDWIGIYEECKT